MPEPKNIKELRSFLGMVTYLSKFIKKLSDESKELRDLEKKSAQWNWNDSHQRCFDNLKKLMCNVETLKYFNPKIPTKIQCDASDFGLGCVLLQDEKPVYYAQDP